MAMQYMIQKMVERGSGREKRRIWKMANNKRYVNLEQATNAGVKMFLNNGNAVLGYRIVEVPPVVFNEVIQILPPLNVKISASDEAKARIFGSFGPEITGKNPRLNFPDGISAVEAERLLHTKGIDRLNQAAKRYMHQSNPTMERWLHGTWPVEGVAGSYAEQMMKGRRKNVIFPNPQRRDGEANHMAVVHGFIPDRKHRGRREVGTYPNPARREHDKQR